MPFLANHVLLQVSCGLLFISAKTPHGTGLRFLKLTERGLRNKEFVLDLLLESYSHLRCARWRKKKGPFLALSALGIQNMINGNWHVPVLFSQHVAFE